MLDSLRLSLQIVKRNWWVYRKDFVANISPTVTDPIFFLIFLGLGLGSMVQEMNGHSYIEFLGPGLVVITALYTAFFETSYGFYVRKEFEGIFKAMLTTPIGVNEIIWGELIWVSLKGAVMVTAVSAVWACLGLFQNYWLFVLLPFVGILVALSCGAMGLISSSLVKNINQFQSVYSFIISPLMFMSGVFYPVASMPQAAQWIAKALPLYHAVEMTRAIFWDENVVEKFLFHGAILVIYSAVLCSIAYKLLKPKLQT